MDFEEIRKIPNYYDRKELPRMIKLLNIKLDFDEELAQIDDEYATNVYRELFDKVITIGDDESKMKMLYAFRYWLRVILKTR